VWELSTADEPVTIISALDRINSVSFSPDGRQVVSGGSDGIVKVWDANTGQQTLTLPGNVDAQIQCVAFSQDGMRLAAADQRGGVMLWDTRPWTPKQRAQAQSRSYLKILRDRVKSLEALTSYIRDDKTISEPVRQQCLDWSELFWKNRAGDKK
jgi:WD40 repeat protein